MAEKFCDSGYLMDVLKEHGLPSHVIPSLIDGKRIKMLRDGYSKSSVEKFSKMMYENNYVPLNSVVDRFADALGVSPLSLMVPGNRDKLEGIVNLASGNGGLSFYVVSENKIDQVIKNSRPNFNEEVLEKRESVEKKTIARKKIPKKRGGQVKIPVVEGRVKMIRERYAIMKKEKEKIARQAKEEFGG